MRKFIYCTERKCLFSNQRIRILWEGKLQPISYSTLCWFKSPPKVLCPTQSSPLLCLWTSEIWCPLEHHPHFFWAAPFPVLGRIILMIRLDYLFMSLQPRAESIFLGWGCRGRGRERVSTKERSQLITCLSEIQAWMAFNFLMFNIEKIELLLIDSAKLCNACTSFIVQWVIRS